MARKISKVSKLGALKQQLVDTVLQSSLEQALALLSELPAYVLLVAATESAELCGGLNQALDSEEIQRLLCTASSEQMLQVLAKRGGHPGAVAEAVLLVIKKSADYNQGMGHLDLHNVDRSSYFPFGDVSYAQMLHTKAQRFNSLVKKAMEGGEPNFEGLRDTALDIVNYAGFFAGAQKK